MVVGLDWFCDNGEGFCDGKEAGVGTFCDIDWVGFDGKGDGNWVWAFTGLKMSKLGKVIGAMLICAKKAFIISMYLIGLL